MAEPAEISPSRFRTIYITLLLLKYGSISKHDTHDAAEPAALVRDRNDYSKHSSMNHTRAL